MAAHDDIFAKFGLGGAPQTAGSSRAQALMNAPTAVAQKQGGILSNNMNSIGAGAGGLAGLALAPETGGLSLLIPALLAAAGGAAGESGKQYLTGRNQDAGEIGKQALIGGATDLGAGLAGKGLSAILGKLGGAGTGLAEKTAQSQLGRAVEDGGSFLNKGTKYNMLNNADEYSKLYSGLGLKPNQLEQAGAAITGSDGALNGIKNELLTKAKHVDTGGLIDIAKESMDSGLMGTQAGKNVLSRVTKLTTPAKLGTAFDGTTAFDAVKTMEGFAKSETNPAAQNVYKAVSDELKNRLFNDAGANAAASAYKVGSSDLTAIRSQVASSGFTGKQADKLTQYMVDSLNKAKSIPDIRAAEAPFVGGSQVGKAQRIGTVADQGLSQVADHIPTNVSGAGRSVKSLVNKLGDSVVAPAAGAIGRGATSLSGALAAASPVIDPLMHSLPQFASSSPEQQMSMQPGMADQGMPPGHNQPQLGENSSQGSIGKEQILQAMQYDMQHNQGKHVAELKMMYELSNSSPKGNAKQEQSKTDIGDAFSFLSTAEQQLTQAGGAKGIAGGLTNIPLAGQYINPAGSSYEQTKIDIATAIAKALTGNSRPAASVIKMYMHSLPSVTDTPQVAAQKLANVRLELTNKAKGSGIPADLYQ